MRVTNFSFFANSGGSTVGSSQKKRRSLSRRARWAVPGTAVAVTAVTVAALQIPAASASPNLPNRTPAQLLASISSDAKVPPMTGTVVETASLGLPALPQTASNPTNMLSLLTGSHTMKVYYQDSKHYRLSVPEPSAETDVIANGSTVWLWQSTTDSVTEFTGSGEPAKQVTPNPTQTPLTPQQAANQVLAKVGQTTLVSVQANVMVAGEASYQLVLAPKDSRSLVGKVVIAIDGKYGVPLRVQLYAKGATSPAFQVGYAALQWVAPAPANFSFTPPKGASVDVVNGAKSASGSKASSNPAGVGSYGKSWLTVVAFPQKDLMQGFGTTAGSSGSSSSSSGQQNIASSNNSGVSVSSQELLSALLGSAKPVHGSWGSGTLVTTSLVSMLMTGGEVYIGAVQPSVLYAAVGHTTS
jgi:outer membrane lipoprotein-sorting protein